MKRTVSRFDIAVKVSEDKRDVIAEVIPEVEKSYKIDLHSKIYPDPSGKGYVVLCVQGLKTPTYQINNAIFDLSTCIRSKCKLQTAIINKSACMLDEANEEASIAAVHKKHMDKLIAMGEEDNLFDGKAYAGIPQATVAEILSHTAENPYAFLDDEATAAKAEIGARISERFEELEEI